MFFSLKTPTVGLGDQMLQYALAYRLVHRIGGIYIHEPMDGDRIFRGVGVFTGIDLYPRHAGDSDLATLPVLDIPLRYFLTESGVLMRPAAHAYPVGRFRIDYEYLDQGPKFWAAVHGAPTFPFRHLYREALSRRPNMNPKGSKPRIVIHLRLGDTVTTSLADGRRLTMDGMRVLGTDPGLSSRPEIDVGAIARLTERLLATTNADIVLLSDGYDRAILNVQDYPHLVPGFERPEQDAVIDLFRARQDILRAIPATICRVGEATDDTRFAIDSLAGADVLIRSTGSFSGTVATCFGDVQPPQILTLDDVLQEPDRIVEALQRAMG